MLIYNFSDLCEEGNHLFWDDPDGLRSAANETLPSFFECDTRITEGWYRIRSPAGTDIPTECVPEQRCSTLGTIWIKGCFIFKTFMSLVGLSSVADLT